MCLLAAHLSKWRTAAISVMPSTSHSSAGTTEEGWEDGGTIIDETIEI